MSGQSTPIPNALVVIIRRNLVYFLQNSSNTLSLMMDVEPAVNMSTKQNHNTYNAPGGSVMLEPKHLIINEYMSATCGSVVQNKTVLAWQS